MLLRARRRFGEDIQGCGDGVEAIAIIHRGERGNLVLVGFARMYENCVPRWFTPKASFTFRHEGSADLGDFL